MKDSIYDYFPSQYFEGSSESLFAVVGIAHAVRPGRILEMVLKGGRTTDEAIAFVGVVCTTLMCTCTI